MQLPNLTTVMMVSTISSFSYTQALALAAAESVAAPMPVPAATSSDDLPPRPATVKILDITKTIASLGDPKSSPTLQLSWLPDSFIPRKMYPGGVLLCEGESGRHSQQLQLVFDIYLFLYL